jgi:hypothetical protein
MYSSLNKVRNLGAEVARKVLRSQVEYHKIVYCRSGVTPYYAPLVSRNTLDVEKASKAITQKIKS